MGDQYYHVEKLIKLYPDARYYMIFGERSNGKTFSVLEYGLKQYVKYGHQLAVVRRFREDFVGGRGQSLFNTLINAGVIKRLTDGEWSDVYYYASRWYLCKYENEKRIIDKTPFAIGFSISYMEHDKGSSYPHVKNIFFDEFMTRSGYLKDEYILFKNVVATLLREYDDLKIFMCGNTVNKYCPYFREMGLRHVTKMKPGDIDVYQYGEDGVLKVAVEYTMPAAKGKKSNIYFAFDNPRLKMITSGEWEIDIYPHLPMKYKPKDIVFEFFVEFEEEKLHSEIVSLNGNNFIFIYPKRDDFKEPDKDIIYSTNYNCGPNWRRNILKPTDKIDKKIYELFKKDKVFYADNETGEVMRNYIEWCSKN